MGTDATDTRQRHPGGRPRRIDVAPERLRQIRQQGTSYRQIARELGVGYGTIYAALHPRLIASGRRARK